MNLNRRISLVIRALLSVIVIVLMAAAAAVTGEKEIIFPETAALTVGAFIADRMPWRVNAPKMLVLMGLSALMGYYLSVHLGIPVYVKVIIAFAVCIIVLSAVKSTMLPMISAGVLPVLTNVQSMIYPLSVVIITAVILLIRFFLLKTGLLSKEEKEYILPDKKEDFIRRVWLIFGFALISAAALYSGMTFMIAPPLAVFFAEAAEQDGPVKKAPFQFFLCTILCAFAGTAVRIVLFDLYSLNMVLCIGAASAISFFLLIIFGKPFPPAAALAILPFILPESVIASYPFQVTAGCAVFVSMDVLYYAAWKKNIPLNILNRIIDFVLSIQLFPPERVRVPSGEEKKDNKNKEISDI